MRLKKRSNILIASIGILMFITVVLSGCKAKEAEETEKRMETTTEITASATVEPTVTKEEEKQLILTEADGTEVVFEKMPEKIVVISYATSTIMDSLGINLAGISSTKRQLTETLKALPMVGIPMRPDIEKILTIEPDLVIMSHVFKGAQEKMFRDNGLKAYFINNQGYNDTIDNIRMFGDFFNKSEKAEGLIDDIKEREEKILNGIKGKSSPKVLIIFGTTQSFQMATSYSYSGSMVKMLGGDNISDMVKSTENSYLPLSVENVILQNPDIILRITHGSWESVKDSFKSEFEDNDLWNTVSAVKNKRVYDLDPGLFHANPGMKVIDALEYLAGIMYP